MPIVMCSYCHHVGSGETGWERWDNVIEHESRTHHEEISAAENYE